MDRRLLARRRCPAGRRTCANDRTRSDRCVETYHRGPAHLREFVRLRGRVGRCCATGRDGSLRGSCGMCGRGGTWCGGWSGGVSGGACCRLGRIQVRGLGIRSLALAMTRVGLMVVRGGHGRLRVRRHRRAGRRADSGFGRRAIRRGGRRVRSRSQRLLAGHRERCLGALWGKCRTSLQARLSAIVQSSMHLPVRTVVWGEQFRLTIRDRRIQHADRAHEASHRWIRAYIQSAFSMACLYWQVQSTRCRNQSARSPPRPDQQMRLVSQLN